MRMKLTKELLRANRAFNDWELCKFSEGRVYIAFTPADSRGVTSSKWQVIGVHEKTDPTGPWYNYGSKSFLGNMRSDALDKAKQWASEKYGIKEFAKSPFRGWHDAEAIKRAEQKLETLVNKTATVPKV